jgi:hypothetical protein
MVWMHYPEKLTNAMRRLLARKRSITTGKLVSTSQYWQSVPPDFTPK